MLVNFSGPNQPHLEPPPLLTVGLGLYLSSAWDSWFLLCSAVGVLVSNLAKLSYSYGGLWALMIWTLCC